MKLSNAPKHVAIIMDGNGRWARNRGHHRVFGHVKGAQVARKIIRSAGNAGIKFLTLYTFSTENWKRPATEVSALMKLLEKYLKKEQKTLMKDNVRFRYIGDVTKLPISAQKILRETVEMTQNNSGLNLVFALNYGARQEIVCAIQNIGTQIQNGQLEPSLVTEKTISDALESSFLPDPELIIRTSGEMRVSNFMLWQMAYSEFYFTDTFWPDFSETEFLNIIAQVQKRERRFGGVSEPMRETSP